MNGMMISSFALSVELGGAFSAERWAYAGKMTLLGIGAVFAVLAILWAVLTVFKLIFVGRSPKKEAAKKTVDTVAPATQEMKKETVTNPSASVENEVDQTMLIAVLTAAVAAYRDSEGCDGGFRVVSFRRTQQGRTWNRAK